MPMLSEDDTDLTELSAEELDAAWDLWFDLAQATNAADPPYSHGVLVNVVSSLSDPTARAERERGSGDRLSAQQAGS